jgi:manganese transport protein
MAIGLNLLFDIPLIWGVMISALDTFLLLFLLNHGIRKMEVFIISLVATIGGAFVVQMFIAEPALTQVAQGFVPTALNDAALYIAIGIIGATVMPHNLYLHSALVQTRKFERTPIETRRAIRFNFIDSTIALNAAFFVNAAILVLAGSAFYSAGLHEVSDITQAHHLLEPLLGSKLAPILFAVALLCAGQSSTITGTLAGQIIMEGYLNLRIAPWIRRLITRLIAILPAVLVIHYYGEESTGDLLILSQVILSLQLGFAVIPLIHFVSDKDRMGEFVISTWTRVAAWTCAGIIVLLNIKLVVSQIGEWLQTDDGITTRFVVIPFAVFSLGMLLYITFAPVVRQLNHRLERIPHRDFAGFSVQSRIAPRQIAVCLDFGSGDQIALQKAIDQGGKEATYILIHITESAGARWLGTEIRDLETGKDLERLNTYMQALASKGYRSIIRHGFGTPSRRIPEIVADTSADLLVMSAHGHKAFMDFLLGSTVDAVRHRVRVPVLIVQQG